MTWRASRYAVALVAIVLTLVARAEPPPPPASVEEACGAGPVEEVDRPAYDSCVLAWVAHRLDALTPGAEFVEALPVLGVFIVGGLGFRIGLAF